MFQAVKGNQFAGTWRESDKRFGKMWFTHLPKQKVIYGYYESDPKCTIGGPARVAFVLRPGKGHHLRPPLRGFSNPKPFGGGIPLPPKNQ